VDKPVTAGDIIGRRHDTGFKPIHNIGRRDSTILVHVEAGTTRHCVGTELSGAAWVDIERANIEVTSTRVSDVRRCRRASDHFKIVRAHCEGLRRNVRLPNIVDGIFGVCHADAIRDCVELDRHLTVVIAVSDSHAQVEVGLSTPQLQGGLLSRTSNIYRDVNDVTTLVLECSGPEASLTLARVSNIKRGRVLRRCVSRRHRDIQLTGRIEHTRVEPEGVVTSCVDLEYLIGVVPVRV
jgi:hypothetical protein